VDITVVNMLDTLKEHQLDSDAASMIKESIEQRGLKFVMPARTIAILAGHGPDPASAKRVRAIRLDDGTELQADLVVMAAGIRPNIDLAKADRKSTRLNSSHVKISYAVFCLKKKKITTTIQHST